MLKILLTNINLIKYTIYSDKQWEPNLQMQLWDKSGTNERKTKKISSSLSK